MFLLQNLLKYRHPCIVRYVSAWQQRSTLHLATEYVQPLSHVLSSQTPLQRCIGLNNILRALVFLHEQVNLFVVCVFIDFKDIQLSLVKIIIKIIFFEPDMTKYKYIVAHIFISFIITKIL